MFLSVMALATERVYLVDTGVLPTTKNQCGPQIRYDLQTIHTHGQEMAAEIEFEAKGLDYCIQSYDVFDDTNLQIDIAFIVKALKHIKNQPVGIINLSIQGITTNLEEKKLLNELARKGFTINIASGNSGKNLLMGCISYPACYFRMKTKNVNVISNTEKYANKNGPTTHVGNLPRTKPGTSGSTARFTGELIKTRLTGFRFYKVTPRRNYVETL